jgi:hypothetical protein
MQSHHKSFQQFSSMITKSLPFSISMSNDHSFISKHQVTITNARKTIPSKMPIPSVAAAVSRNVSSDKNAVGPNDVVCGRGKGSYNRPGNKKFRALVQDHVPLYMAARTKLDKSMVLSCIVEKVREQGGGRFLKRRKGGEWYEIGDEQAREKVGHAIREAIATGEKKSQATEASLSSSLAGSPKKPLEEETQSEFQSKQNDLLSTQLSIFEGLVARASSPDNASAASFSSSPDQSPSQQQQDFARTSFQW